MTRHAFSFPVLLTLATTRQAAESNDDLVYQETERIRQGPQLLEQWMDRLIALKREGIDNLFNLLTCASVIIAPRPQGRNLRWSLMVVVVREF